MGTVLEVDTLGREAIAEALSQLQQPADVSDPDALLDTLHRLTDGGDPLLLSLWLGQISKTRGDLPVLDAQTLGELQPSFAGFYQDWMRDQAALWRERRLSIPQEDFEQVLHVLALAQGPLLPGDLLGVLQHVDPHLDWSVENLGAALASAHRMVVGGGTDETGQDEQGYVFVHPRLAHHFQEIMQPGRLHAIRCAFREWGAHTVQHLNTGERDPQSCPRYLLRHYVAAHIEIGEEDPAGVLERYLLPLLQQGWAHAWHAHTGAWQEYWGDLKRVSAALEAYNRDRVSAGRPGELRLVEEMRCALLAATVRSLNVGLPGYLVLSLARTGVWSLARASRVVQECWSPEELLADLAAIALEKSNAEEAQRLWGESLDSCKDGHALAEVVARLPADRSLLTRALEVATRVPARGRAAALAAISGRAPAEPGGMALLQRMLETAEALQDLAGRAWVLLRLGAHLQGEPRHTTLLQALEAARTLGARGDRPEDHQRDREGQRAMLEIVEAGTPLLRGDRVLLLHALESVAAAKPDHCRLTLRSALVALAGQLPGDHALLQRVVDLAASAGPATLAAVAEHLRGSNESSMRALAEKPTHSCIGKPEVRIQTPAVVVQEVLQAASEIGYAEDKDALRRIVQALEPDVRLAVLQEVIAQLPSQWNPQSALPALAEAAAGLHGETGQALRQQLLQMTLALFPPTYAGDVARQVEAVARLDKDARPMALQQFLARLPSLKSSDDLLPGLVEGAAPLDDPTGQGLRQQLLEAVSGIQDLPLRAELLLALGRQFQGPLRRTVLLQGLHTLALIPDDGSGRIIGGEMRGEARRNLLHRCLKLVVPDLEADPKLLAEALEAVRMIHDGQARDRALALLRDGPVPGREVGWFMRHAERAPKTADEPEALQRRLDDALAFGNDFIRAFELKQIFPQVKDHPAARERIMAASLGLSRSWTDRIQLCVANACLAPRQPTYELWHRLVSESCLERLLLLNVTDELAGCAIQLTDRADVADGIAQAIEDVCRWWP
jgi:hypothetical protein